MIKYIFTLPLILVFSFGCSSNKSPAQGQKVPEVKSYGHDQGNGSENVDFSTPTAWFLGDREVRYCLDIGGDFGLSLFDAAEEIKASFKVWSDYIIDKNLNEEIKRYNDVRERVNTPRIEDLKGLFLKSKYVGACTNAHDLAFYLGVESSSEIVEAKHKFSNPWSFAVQRNYDPKLRWGNGFIWVAKEGRVFPSEGLPNWSLDNRFKGIILHELGHVLGIGHIDGTIMRSSFYSLMRESKSQVKEYVRRSLTEIDFPVELYLQEFTKSHYDLAGFVGPKNSLGNPYPEEKAEATFKLFTDVEAVGEITTRLMGQKFILSDEKASHEFDLAVNTNDKLDFDSQFIFGHHQADMSGSEGISWLFHNSQVIPGLITTKSGEEVLISLERNVYGASILIRYFVGPQKHFLFFPDIPKTCHMIEVDGVLVCR